MEGRLTLNIGDNLLDALLGYLVVFIGLTLLMCVVVITGKIMVAKLKKPAAAPAAEAPAAKAAAPAAPKKLAPGSAGDVKLYDTDPRDAAMIMAIVADKLQKPLNELRFVSIKEVK
jgi:Na+-transporting methylmalonyl-CoA/oxaloacetate decarboxylase gamma subunit